MEKYTKKEEECRLLNQAWDIIYVITQIYAAKNLANSFYNVNTEDKTYMFNQLEAFKKRLKYRNISTEDRQEIFKSINDTTNFLTQ